MLADVTFSALNWQHITGSVCIYLPRLGSLSAFIQYQAILNEVSACLYEKLIKNYTVHDQKRSCVFGDFNISPLAYLLKLVDIRTSFSFAQCCYERKLTYDCGCWSTHLFEGDKYLWYTCLFVECKCADFHTLMMCAGCHRFHKSQRKSRRKQEQRKLEDAAATDSEAYQSYIRSAEKQRIQVCGGVWD